MLVVLSHMRIDQVALNKLVPGGLGVTVFFFISGFIITRLLVNEQAISGTIDKQAFWSRRFWRLWPVIFVSATVAFFLGGFSGQPVSIGQYLSSLGFFQNYFQILTYPQPNPLNVHWSLAVEQHFYLIFPFFLALIFNTTPLTGLRVIGATLVFFLVLRALSYEGAQLDPLWEGYPEDVAGKLSHTRMDSILWGVFLAYLTSCTGEHIRDKVGPRLFSQPAIWAGLAVLVLSVLIRDETYRATLRYSLQGAGVFLVFSGLLFAKDGGFVRWVLNLGPMVWLGSISFSLYLWHVVVWRAVRTVSGVEQGIVVSGVTILISLVVAHLSWVHIEKRFMRHAYRRSSVVH